MSDLTWPGGVNPATCTDREWFDVTEGNFCGGCGNETDTCHPGVPCGATTGPDPMRGAVDVCHYCQTRVDTGQVPAVVRAAARAAAGLEAEADE